MAKWEELPIADRAQYMRVAVQNGYRDIRSIREAYNRYAEGGNLYETGGPKGAKKVGPTYNPQTKKWTNSKGQDITGKSFKGQYGTTTYLDSGAVDLDASAVSGKYDDHRYRYASNAPRVYIGESTNEARQKYFDTDTELTNTVKAMAKQYGISPSVLASRIAKEGPIDEAIRNYNNTNGYLQRGDMIGPIWGLDDMGTWITNGTVKLRKGLMVDTDYEMENEKGRTTYSVGSDNYMDGVKLTAVALKYFKDEMRKQYPKASEAQLEQYATAAFNNGMAGATSLINQGKIQNAYRPFINIRKDGGEIEKTLDEVVVIGHRPYKPKQYTAPVDVPFSEMQAMIQGPQRNYTPVYNTPVKAQPDRTKELRETRQALAKDIVDRLESNREQRVDEFLGELARLSEYDDTRYKQLQQEQRDIVAQNMQINNFIQGKAFRDGGLKRRMMTRL